MIELMTLWSPFGMTRVFRRRATKSVVYKHEGRIQSEVANNGVSLAYYVHAIFGLISQVETRSILMIGCGGGTLATMLRRVGRSVRVVDIDASAFVIAKDYFSLPVDVPCHTGDGKEFLRSDPGIYDVIVIDAFHGSHVPADFCSEDFYKLAQSRLAPGGAIIVNVIVSRELGIVADDIAKSMSSTFQSVRILETPSPYEHNAIVVAGEVSQLQLPRMIVEPDVIGHCIEEDISTMKFRTRVLDHDE